MFSYHYEMKIKINYKEQTRKKTLKHGIKQYVTEIFASQNKSHI